MAGHTPWKYLINKSDNRVTRLYKRIGLWLWRRG